MRPNRYIRDFFSYARSIKKQKSKPEYHIREITFIIPHAKKYVSKYISLFLLLIISSGLSLPGPAITGIIVDKVFVKKESGKLTLFVGILLVILILSEIVRTVQEYSMFRLSQEFTYSIRINLIERILRYPLSFFTNIQTGYLVSRLDEVNLLGNFFSINMLSLAENIVRFAGAVLIISRYNIKLTLISVMILPLFFEVARRSRTAIRESTIDTMEKSAKARGKIQETFSGIEIVKTYAKEGHEATEIKTRLRNMIDIEIVQNLLGSLSGKMLGFLTSANLLVILWIGGHEIIAGRLTVGQYFAFVAYIGYLYGPIQMFALMYLQFQKAIMSCKRISEFLNITNEDERPERNREINTLKGNIKFNKVRYHYEKGNDVLHDITFSIEVGEKIAFVGKNGAGKSTLIHLILGLYEPTAGNIEIDGIDLKSVRLQSIRKRIGIVSQNIFLFDDSIINNIKYSCPNASMEEVIAAARASGCHDFVSRLPDGYETNAGEIGKKLSGGEKQLISIARCLIKKPDLIIFDEPTAPLDSAATNNLIASIQELFRNKTCIIISHHLYNINWIDRIFVLEKGRIVQSGIHDDLVKKKGEYQELFERKRLESESR